jgi:hypothetical protein
MKCPYCLRNNLPTHELEEQIKDGHKLYKCTVLNKKFCEHMAAATSADIKLFACQSCDVEDIRECDCNDCFGVFCQKCNDFIDIECPDVSTLIRINERDE